MNIAFVCTNIQPFILKRIHQIVSPISNFESTNLYDKYLSWLLFQLANWEEKPLLKQKIFFFIFNCTNWERFMEKFREINWWKYLMNPTLEFHANFGYIFSLHLQPLHSFWRAFFSIEIPLEKSGVFYEFDRITCSKHVTEEYLDSQNPQNHTLLFYAFQT